MFLTNNFDVFMKKSSILLLLTGVSAVTLLSGCDMFSNLKNPFKDERPPQSVVGVRRVPPMNQNGAASAQAPASSPAGAYDYYNAFDAKGQPASPYAAAAAPTPATKAQKNTKRKPLPGNPQVSQETHVTAPVAPTSQPAPVASEVPPWAIVHAPEDAPVDAAPAPVETKTETTETPAAKPTWIERVMGKTDAQAQPRDAEQNAPYPELSSVPPTPTEFKSVKEEKQQRMEELQSDHMQAAQDKQALDSEPSEQGSQQLLGHAQAPLEPSQPVKIETQIGSSEPAPVEIHAPVRESKSGQPRRGVDIMTEEEWQAYQAAKAAAAASPPPPPPVAEVPPEAAPVPAPKKKHWWQDIFPQEEKTAPAPSDDQASDDAESDSATITPLIQSPPAANQ